NPTAMILSGRLMFDYMGWTDAANLVRDAVEETISSGTVTYDLARQREDAEKVGTSAYAETIVENVEKLS
ncbi:MAG: isocitrate/isopropylmalate family dehydrogenase, partial [Haloarculaceae archaeon]